ncbi:MAG: DUF2007 domain-containing protein [Myxococcaceae bacterium]|nr:DUF2007 domain-containing protein [Myxococcaceae bacterium]
MAHNVEGTRLVLLHECADQMELALIKSLLDGEGISYVAQGEHHASLISGQQLMIAVKPRVLVAERDAEHAHALLSAVPRPEAEATLSVADALCPVHENPAIATCDRCGTFLCTACAALGNPPLCEDCLAHEARGVEQGEIRPPRSNLAPVLILSAIVAAAVLVAYLVPGR